MSQRKTTKTDAKKRQTTDGRRSWGSRLLWGGVAIVVLGGAVAIAVDLSQPEPPPPAELENVETFPDMGVLHLAEGAPIPEYNSDPPTSGPHGPAPAACGLYRQPVPDFAQLHSMEHGAVVVQYHPDLPPEQVELLESIDWSPAAEVILAPRPDNPAPVALTAWTKRLPLDEVDVEVITAFERQYSNRSPEGGARCPMQVDETR